SGRRRCRGSGRACGRRGRGAGGGVRRRFGGVVVAATAGGQERRRKARSCRQGASAPNPPLPDRRQVRIHEVPHLLSSFTPSPKGKQSPPGRGPFCSAFPNSGRYWSSQTSSKKAVWSTQPSKMLCTCG